MSLYTPFREVTDAEKPDKPDTYQCLLDALFMFHCVPSQDDAAWIRRMFEV